MDHQPETGTLVLHGTCLLHCNSEQRSWRNCQSLWSQSPNRTAGTPTHFLYELTFLTKESRVGFPVIWACLVSQTHIIGWDMRERRPIFCHKCSSHLSCLLPDPKSDWLLHLESLNLSSLGELVSYRLGRGDGKMMYDYLPWGGQPKGSPLLSQQR